MTPYLEKDGGGGSGTLDLFLVHERVGSSSDPGINGHLHYPNDLDGQLNETAADKIRKYQVLLISHNTYVGQGTINLN